MAQMALPTSTHGREVVRYHQWLRDLPATNAGQRIYIDPFCRDSEEASATWGPGVLLSTIIQANGAVIYLSRSVDTAPPERVRALRANRLGVDIVVSLCLPRDEASGVFYFASNLSTSTAGKALAEHISGVLGIRHGGRAIPILKNTRSTAVVVALPHLDEASTTAIAQGIMNLFSEREPGPTGGGRQAPV